MSESQDVEARAHLIRLFHRLFDQHPACVAMLDLSANVLAVNESWRKFGRENGLAPSYEVVGENYLAVIERAANQELADAVVAVSGLLEVMHTSRKKFTHVYGCHSPHERRWFKLWIEAQMPYTPVIIVAHQLVRSEAQTPSNAAGLASPLHKFH